MWMDWLGTRHPGDLRQVYGLVPNQELYTVVGGNNVCYDCEMGGDYQSCNHPSITDHFLGPLVGGYYCHPDATSCNDSIYLEKTYE